MVESASQSSANTDSMKKSSHAQLAAARFDDWAETYGEDRISAWFSHYQSRAIASMGLTGQMSFLDVGCGVGKAVVEAARSLDSGRACGIDISPAMIAKAKKLSPPSAQIHFEVADSESIPFDERSFDRVLCTFSFHHYAKPDIVLQEIRRIMKPNGTFVLVDAARDVSLAIWLQDRWRRYLERSHVKYYTVAEMRQLLTNAGFSAEFHTIKRFRDHGKLFTGLMLAECSIADSTAFSGNAA